MTIFTVRDPSPIWIEQLFAVAIRVQRLGLQDSPETSRAMLAYALGMRGRAGFAAMLIVVAIGCVPGRLGVVDVGAIIPPMPLKTTPETLGDAPAPRPTSTATPPATPTPTPTPDSPTSGGPEFLPPPPDQR